jgi:hypothetical protein
MMMMMIMPLREVVYEAEVGGISIVWVLSDRYDIRSRASWGLWLSSLIFENDI